MPHMHPYRCVLIITILGAILPHSAAAADYALVIQADADGLPNVFSTTWPPTDAVRNSHGLLVWTDGRQEHWVALPCTQLSLDASADDALLPLAASASRGAESATSAVMSSGTLQLDQLMAQLVVRGAGFITPVAAESDLDGQITIRRMPGSDAAVGFPADEFHLSTNGKTIAVIKCAAGVQVLRWSQLTDLPEPLRGQLPEGEYTLRATSGGASVTFRVETREIRDWVNAPLQRLKELTTETDPLYVQVAVEHLLDQRDDAGRPAPYLSDALDLITNLPTERQTVHLRQIASDLTRRLTGLHQTVAKPLQEVSGLDVIETARAALRAGRWAEALELLTGLDPGGDRRVAGLRVLYRAVILAEYGATTGDVAESLFQESLQVLEQETPADRLRAHNNYANFLLNRAQDRVYNHAFQVATGAADSLSSALIDWRNSRDHYHAAYRLAETSDPAAAIEIRVNQARLYVLLADLVRTLNTTVASEQAFTLAEQSAAREAERLAKDVLDHKDVITPAVDGIVHEILAHLAYRDGRADECRRHAEHAMARYLSAGTLTGIESIHRLLGLVALRFAETRAPQIDTQQTALTHFLLSNFLAEFLRSRVPDDRMGLSLAGYFARRAYVNEQIIGLLVTAGRHAEALEFAEAGKAQALNQVLRQHAVAANRPDRFRTVHELLADWPAHTTALEYLLGSERGWVFVVRDGTVFAQELRHPDGTPLSSRELVARVQHLLGNINSAARKMFQRRRFDHEWQTELHALYTVLIPAGMCEITGNTETLLIVPHHVLHYFPFAALVTKPDSGSHAPLEMPMPAFLIDDLNSGLSRLSQRPPTAAASAADIRGIETSETKVTAAGESAAGCIAYAPSLTAWDVMRRKSKSQVSRVNAVGIVDFQSATRLPGVEQDLVNLKAAFGAHVNMLVEGAAASEQAVAGLLNEPGLLFVATHGMNVADQPLDSFLLCHSDQTHDGRLTAGEIFLSPLSADIVVMSACYSGLADRSPLPGDDLFGLQRAFLHSGVQTVVSGLWDVYDATGPLLMNDFFQHFSDGEPAAAALANAQRDFLKQQRAEGPGNPWTHPYFWAVYTAAGNPQLKFVAKVEGDRR